MLNRVVVVGRLVRDPELRKTNSGSSVVAFTVAVDNRQKSNGEKSASFLPCIAWNATAENVSKFIKKGSLVGVDGHLNQRSYQGRDGKNVNVIEIIADSVQFLERKSDVSSSSAPSSKAVAKPSGDANAPTEEESSEDSTSSDSNGIDTTDDQLPF